MLGYILEMHEMGKAYASAQDEGVIPADEPFIHNLVIDTSDPTHPTFTGLDVAALSRLHAFMASGRMTWYAHWRRAEGGSTDTRCVLSLSNGQFLSSTCTLRSFAIEGISSLAVAEELALAELGWLIHRYEKDEPVALSHDQGTSILAELDHAEWRCGGGINVPSHHW